MLARAARSKGHVRFPIGVEEIDLVAIADDDVAVLASLRDEIDRRAEVPYDVSRGVGPNLG